MRARPRALGVLQPLVELAFEPQPVGERHVEAAHHRLLDPLHPKRRALADLARDLLALRHQAAHRHHVIDESQTQRLGGADSITRVEHLERAPERNQPRQALRAPAPGEPSKTHLAKPELRVLGGHADVAAERLLEPAAVGVAVDRHDDRFGKLEHHRIRRVEQFFVGLLDVVGLDVAAGAERALARAGEDRDPERRVLAELAPDLREAPVGLEVAGVEPLGTIDRDVGDRPPLFEQHFHRTILPALSPLLAPLAFRDHVKQGARKRKGPHNWRPLVTDARRQTGLRRACSRRAAATSR